MYYLVATSGCGSNYQKSQNRGGAAGGDDGDAAVDEAHISNKQKKLLL